MRGKKILSMLLATMLSAGILSMLPGPAGAAEHMLEIPAPPVRLVVSGAKHPVELRALDMKSDIAGHLAWTTVEMTFYNPNGRVLEGELDFPLLGGQIVTGFALSMGDGEGKDVMRDAVPVEKAKGRQVFEDVIRQKVDPALLEVTQGNNFKLRVYPLNPGKTKRVSVTYSERLSEADGKVIFRLPLSYADRVETFKLSVRVPGSRGAPAISGAVPSGLSFNTGRSGRDYGAYIVSAEQKNVKLSGSELNLSLPLREDVAYLGKHDGVTYFYADVTSPAGLAIDNERGYPKKLSILWDASSSGQKRNHSKELEFLGAFFERAGDVAVSLQTVRDMADETVAFSVKNGDWTTLKKHLETIIYDGATNLGAFDTGVAQDAYFLFSDGLDNYSLSPLVPSSALLYAFISSPGADLPRLRRLTSRNGGAIVDLNALDAKTAIAGILKVRPHIASVGGSGISEVFWSSITSQFAQGSFVITGIVSDPTLPISVVFSDSDGRREELKLKRLSSEANDKAFEDELFFDGVPYVWAALKVEHLEEDYDLNHGDLRRIGKAFGIATRDTSLIVLDRVEDYVTYGIEPPTELKKEYDRLRAQSSKPRLEQNKIERVAKEWQQRDEWWKKDFPMDNPPKSKQKSPARIEAGSDGAPMTGAVLGSRRREPAARSASPHSAPVSASDSKKAPAGVDTDTQVTIALRPWTSDAPYIRRMKEARGEDIYRIYLDERPDFENSVAFYLDVSYQLLDRGQKALSLRVLSNLAEMNLENRQILRVLGYRLLEAEKPAQAVSIFKRVLKLADDEPQSYRDLGLAAGAEGDYQLAVDRLYDVVERSFARNFPGIEVIALTEMNALIEAVPVKPDTRRVDPRFLLNRPLAIRVVLTWDSDNTDIDLHVADPNGEEVFYGKPLSYQGGRVSPDNTVGYGPEDFTLKTAKPGKYRVDVKFYGHTQQKISEATTIQLDFFTGYGTKNQQRQSLTMRLKEAKDRIFVGEFEVN